MKKKLKKLPGILLAMGLAISSLGSTAPAWAAPASPNIASEKNGSGGDASGSETRTRNVALGQRATATSSGDNTPDKAVDGTTDTRWATRENAEMPQSLTVHFDRTYIISSVVLHFEDSHPVDYELQYSDSPQDAAEDQIDWYTLKTVTGNNTYNENITYTFEQPVEANDIRIYVTKASSKQWGCSIKEFEVYGWEKDPVDVQSLKIKSETGSYAVAVKEQELRLAAEISPTEATYRKVGWKVTDENGQETALAEISDDGVLKPKGNGTVQVTATALDRGTVSDTETVTISNQDRENLALNKNVSASAENGDNKKEKAVDGIDGKKVDGKETGTRWESDENNDAWYSIDLGGLYYVDQVILRWESAFGKKYKIQGSLDGTDYFDLYTEENGDGKIDNLTFANNLVCHVKMQGVERGTKYAYSLWEFEVYGQEAKEGLQAKYEQYRAYDQSLYTEDTFAALQAALEKVQAVLEVQDPTAEAFMAADTALQTAVGNLREKNEADKTALKNAIRLAEEESKNEEQYTPASYQAMQEILARAKMLEKDRTASQELVDQTTASLDKARGNLEKFGENADIKNIALGQMDVSATTAAADHPVEHAVDGDRTTRWGSTEGAPQESSFTIHFDRTYQISGTRVYFDAAYPINYKLQYAVSPQDGEKGEVEWTDLADVSGNSSQKAVHAFAPVEAGSVRIVSSETSNKEWGFSIYEWEIYGKDAAVPVAADKTALNAAIAEAREKDGTKYTQESYQNLTEVLDRAIALASREDASQADVDAMTGSLRAAMSGLVESPGSPSDPENPAQADKSKLNQMIAKAQGIAGKDYTAESYRNLTDALAAAKALAAKEGAAQDEVDAMVKRLETAVNSLKKADADVPPDDNPSDDHPSGGNPADDDPVDDNPADDDPADDDPSDNNPIVKKISKAVLSKTSCTYNGKQQKPGVTVYDGKKKLKADKDYTLSYKNNKAVGTASVTVKGKGAYTGTLTKKFSIVPQGTSLSGKITAKSKGFTVKWKKVKSVTGYQIQYSTSKKFTKKTTVTKSVKKASTIKWTAKKLKSKKTYYVRVRAYQKVKGKTYYAGWSKVKTVRTKK